MNLDDQSGISRLDKSGMLSIIESMPERIEEAFNIAKNIDLGELRNLTSVLVIGVGGSGISGDVARVLCENQCEIPIVVNKGYGLPNFVGASTLVFVVSYSGDTEEALFRLNDLSMRRAEIVCVSSGGKLLDYAQERNNVTIRIPAGLQPRAALAYLAIPILVVLDKLDLCELKREDIHETFDTLRNMCNEIGVDVELRDNLAKKMAMDIWGSVPVVYGAEGPSSIAALRWKCQFNENSKQPALYNNLPELNHNETVGWEKTEDVIRMFTLVFLKDMAAGERNIQRMGITRELIGKMFRDVLEVESRGSSPLCRFFSLVYFGDLVSGYLALLNDVDPTPVDRIKVLKESLAKLNFSS
ncbi:MAG: bifunctional phosphoglucose/phosphomannose isomerase [Actinobacteria bacterium]|nr:bifunctional phosphoglucose/phosphomannose isomerase [Actinomycetota bacterium]